MKQKMEITKRHENKFVSEKKDWRLYPTVLLLVYNLLVLVEEDITTHMLKVRVSLVLIALGILLVK